MAGVSIGEVLHFYDESDEKKSLIGYPNGRMLTTITDFAATLSYIGMEDFKLWTEKNVEYFLSETISYEENLDIPNAKANAFHAYKTLAAFLTFAAKKGYLSLSEKQIGKLLSKVEKGTYLADPVVPYDPEGKGKGLSKFQEKTIRQYLELTDKWADKYVSSPNYVDLFGSSDGNTLKLIMYYLVVNNYEVHRKTPQTWTKKSIADIMTYDFVKQLNFPEQDRDQIVPTLVNFMDYLADNDLLKREKAEKYQRFFTEIEPKMLKLMRDDLLVNPEKLTIEEISKRGWSLPEDAEAISEFGEEYMKNGALESSKERLKFENDDDYGDMDDEDFAELLDSDADMLGADADDDGDPRQILKNPEQLRQVAEIYDPDKNQEFLRGDHIDSKGLKTWNETDAMKNHARGVQLALKFFLLRTDYGLGYDLPSFETIQAISQIVDHFYNHFLETPEEWKTQSMITFAGIIRGHASSEGILIFTNFFRMLANDRIISIEKSQKFIDTLHGKNKKTLGSFSISKGKLKRKKKKKKKKKKRK